MKLLTFSFDDGPSTDIPMARLFRDAGVTATFYLVAQHYKDGIPQKDDSSVWKYRHDSGCYPDMKDYEGMEIGCHTWSHAAPMDSNDYYEKEVRLARETLQKFSGQHVICFAYPWGTMAEWLGERLHKAGFFYARAANADIQKAAYSLDRWSIPISFQLEPQMEDQVLDCLSTGISLHVGVHSWGHEGKLLPIVQKLIETAKKNGYTIVRNSHYFNMRVPVRGWDERLDRVKKFIPDLLAMNGSCFYIGAEPRRFQLIPDLFLAGYKITLLEVWQQNYFHYFGHPWFENVICEDVRKFEPDRKWDVVMWWHGPEHIPKEDFISTVKKLERMANKLIMFACPWGIYVEGCSYGNPFETHEAYLYEEDFTSLGYGVDVIGEKDIPGSNLIAWKWIG